MLTVARRWNNLLEEIAEQLHSSKALLQLWQRYKDYTKQCASAVQQQEDQTSELLKAVTNKDIADDEVTKWIQDCNVRPETCLRLALPDVLQCHRFCRASVAVCELSGRSEFVRQFIPKSSPHLLKTLLVLTALFNICEILSHCFIFKSEWLSPLLP